MDIVLASSAVDRAFEPRLGKTKDERNDMSIRGLLFQLFSYFDIRITIA
jgi:hypothetical protein